MTDRLPKYTDIDVARVFLSPDVRVETDVNLGNIHRYKKPAGKAPFRVHINGITDTPQNWAGIIDMSTQTGLPIKVIGGGTNIMFTEDGFQGILVTYNSQGKVEVNPDQQEVYCQATVPLSQVVKIACYKGLDLSEFAGIPGTTGAAVVNNSGVSSTETNIGNFVSKLHVIDLSHKQEVIFEPDPDFYGQRTSKIKYNTEGKILVRGVVLKPNRGITEEVIQRYNENLAFRRTKNLEAAHTAGSFFVNRIPYPTGQDKSPLLRDLVARTPLAQLNLNGAHFTPTYGFLNTGKQTRDRDVAELLQRTIETMEREFGITPTSEVEIIGPNGTISTNEFIATHI